MDMLRSAGDPRPVSIRDVAMAVGVSYQTVSRVINGHPSVKESTRAAVLAAIAQLGFRPNRAARALAGGLVQSVTVLTGDTTLYGPAQLLRGIEEAARAADFVVSVRVINSAAPLDVRAAVDNVVESGGAVIVVAWDHAGTRALAAVPRGVPVAAAVETPLDGRAEGRPWVWIDDRAAAAVATRHLLDFGHRTVHYVSIPSPVDTRMIGWRETLLAAGITPPEPVRGRWDPRSGYEAGQRLARDRSATAVLCGNDDMAFGLLRALHDAGRTVPDSMSVVGFDDMPQSEFAIPALTTVRQDFAALGRACFGLLRDRMDDPAAVRVGPAPVLIHRESCGPPPARRTTRTRRTTE